MMKLTYSQHFIFPGVVQSLVTRTGYRNSQRVERKGDEATLS